MLAAAADQVWRLAQLGALVGAIVLMASSRPMTQIRAHVTAQSSLGGSAASVLVVAVVALGLFYGLLQSHGVASPLLTSPLGAAFGLIARPQAFLVLAAALASVSCVVWLGAAASQNEALTRAHEGRNGTRVVSVLLFAWFASTLLATVLHGGSLGEASSLGYVTSAFLLLTVILLSPLASPTLSHSLFAILAALTVVVTAGSYLLYPAWSTTTLWTGGWFSAARLQGPLPQPNVLAVLLILMIFVFMHDRGLGRRLRLLLILASVILLLLTGSRGGLIMLGVGLLAGRLAARSVFVRLVAFIGLLATALIAPLVVANDSQFANGRGETWARAGELMSQNSLLLGGGSFPEVGQLGQVGFYAHNQVLQSLVESGVFGLVALVGALFVGLVTPAQLSGVQARIGFAMLASLWFENPIRIFEVPFVPLAALLIWALLMPSTRSAEPTDVRASFDSGAPRVSVRESGK